ncbi:MAG: hypothetical protein EXS64_03880 [Candidatus Latescibacteria bacterium]|nr:hypothetical protein [Candidatus Latescibacterota bacterium]
MSTFAEDVVQEALAGETLAAADRILIDPKPGALVSLVGQTADAARGRWDSADAAGQRRLVELGLRLGLNLAGRDALAVGYGAGEVDQAFRRIADSFIEGDQDPEASAVIRSVAGGILADMKSVNAGDSLSGLMAERIEAGWKGEGGRTFLELFRQELRGGVYWAMTDGKMCKFGNDFARGLEYLRHIGFCQVSTNPVLAARAFEEDPRLVETFREEAARHADWMPSPDSHGDAMAMAATLIALWPNLAVFRPLALHTGLMDYVVSFQLNPNLADNVADSLADARAAYRSASDFLTGYDRSLGLGTRAGAVRPNIVFKVAATSEAARDITRALNAEGIGTNNTVVYTVGQEVQLILDAFEGKAYAIKAGNGVTRTYETNMGGRLVSHLREEEAEKIFAKVVKTLGESRAEEHLMTLALALNVDRATLDKASSFADRVRAICAFKFLKSLAHKAMVEIAEAAGLKQAKIEALEQDLRKAGTLVARRVYRVFYGPESRPRWVAYLQKRYALSQEQSETVLSSMDVLPASKRIPEDTYHTLGYPNFCNTEFPNHARAVQLMSETEGFQLEAFREAILQAYDPGVTKRLNKLPDFRLAYDLTPDMKNLLLNEVGIAEVADWGTSGIQPEEWKQFGSVQKTLAEFRAAYDAFVVKCIGIAREVAAKRS